MVKTFQEKINSALNAYAQDKTRFVETEFPSCPTPATRKSVEERDMIKMLLLLIIDM